MPQVQSNSLMSSSSIYDLYDLLSSYSYRPVVEDQYNYERNSDKVIRIASWNLKNLTQEKARNLGVVEVICCTILENKWSIIAIQEIREPLALKIICDELNRPAINCIKEYKDNSRCWKFCMCGSNVELGFIYDSISKDIGVDIAYLSHKNLSSNFESSAATSFLVGDVIFTIVNMTPASKKLEDFQNELKELSDTFQGPVLVMEDVNNIKGDPAMDTRKEISGFKSILPLCLNTSCHYLKSNLRFTDTIFINDITSMAHFTETWGIVRGGLVHLAIPDGWDWGGAVSTHCPVWGEFYVLPNEGAMRTHKITLESNNSLKTIYTQQKYEISRENNNTSIQQSNSCF